MAFLSSTRPSGAPHPSLCDLQAELDSVDLAFALGQRPLHTFDTAVSQLREVFYSLLLNLKTSFLQKTDSEALPTVGLKGFSVMPVVCSLFVSSLTSLSHYCSQIEVAMLVRECAESLCECVVRELRILGVSRTGMAWLRDFYMLLEEMGSTFQSLGYRFLPRSINLTHTFHLVFYEKIERDRLCSGILDLARSGFRLLDKETLNIETYLQHLSATALQPTPFKVRRIPPATKLKERVTKPRVERMSLDDLVQFINKPERVKKPGSRATTASASPLQHTREEEFAEEVRRFREKLERTRAPGSKLKPTTSADWLTRLQARASQSLVKS